MSRILTDSARRFLPELWKSWLRWRLLGGRPPLGRVRFGDLRRLRPISDVFGLDRGQPIDRYYIEAFLSRWSDDIRGSVLEIADDVYTRRFGGDRVVESHVLHAEAGNPRATVVGDLSGHCDLPRSRFDCVIVTQTLNFIFDVRAALETLDRLLKPGGVLLATVPGICQISRYDMDRWGDYWRFTTASAERLLSDLFPSGDVTIEAYGNVLVANAFLQGLASSELTIDELDQHDRDYQVVIAIRAVKARAPDLASSDRY